MIVVRSSKFFREKRFVAAWWGGPKIDKGSAKSMLMPRLFTYSKAEKVKKIVMWLLMAIYCYRVLNEKV